MIENTENWPEDRFVVKTADRYDDGGWGISTTDHSGFLITAEEAKKTNYEPQPGDEVILYGGWGSTIKGIMVNGHVFRYKTKAQVEADRRKWLADYAREKEERFYANIADWTKRKEALPEPYRERMNRFINKRGKDFWIEDGGYELFTLEQSAMMVEEAKRHDPINPVAWLYTFRDLDWDEQKNLMPKLHDGHSGNTFGGAVALALGVLQGEDI